MSVSFFQWRIAGLSLLGSLLLAGCVPDPGPNRPVWNLISDGHEDSGVLLVFLHGLGGQEYTTWNFEDSDATWMDRLKDDEAVKHAAIFSVDYSSAHFGKGFPRTEIAEKIGQGLFERSGRASQIVIVAHSQGGVVAREAITSICDQISDGKFYTLITLGAPFAGSDYSSLAKLLPGLSSEQTVSLSTGSESLGKMNEAWARTMEKLGSRLQQFAVYEDSPVVGMVVDKASATLHVDMDNCFEAVGYDHGDLARKAPDGPVYQKVREWVLRSVGAPIFEGAQPIDSPVRIRSGAKLRIRPGTTLTFRPGSSMWCEGQVEAIGTREEPIVFDFSEGNASLVLRGLATADSEFAHCLFKGGKGTGLEKKEPNVEDDITDWVKTIQPNNADNRRFGGAITLIDTDNVDFAHCTFRNNVANLGGAVMALGCERSDFDHCLFENNRSSGGGGAVFTQWSDLYLKHCEFTDNATGRISPKEGETSSSCGGAVYLGKISFAEFRHCLFRGNRAPNAGHHLYSLDAHKGRRKSRPSLMYDCELVAPATSANSIYFDAMTFFELEQNHASTESDEPIEFRRIVTDQSYRLSDNRLTWSVRIDKEPLSPDPQRVPVPKLDVKQALIAEENCFAVRSTREIDTVVIHHISAINWNEPGFARDPKFKKRREAFLAEEGRRQAAGELAQHKFRADFCIEILKMYGVSAHYLIERDGTIHQLVEERNVAYHAGASQMPNDGRKGVNEFSIGIELISAHPDLDPTIRNGSTLAYTDNQYRSLNRLLRNICLKHPIEHIVGHDEIAGTAAVQSGLRSNETVKKDPGPLFDWTRMWRELALSRPTH